MLEVQLPLGRAAEDGSQDGLDDVLRVFAAPQAVVHAAVGQGVKLLAVLRSSFSAPEAVPALQPRSRLLSDLDSDMVRSSKPVGDENRPHSNCG